VHRIAKLAVLVVSLSLTWANGASAATLDLVGDFDRPIFVTSDPSDPDRLLVVEREGRVMLVDATGVSLFGELESLVSCCTSERGLLSIAPAPDFPTSERFYAAYTGTSAAGDAEGDIHIDAFTPEPGGGGDLVREPILAIDHDDFPTHHGGQLQFGPDGFLYISTGDGGGAGDPLESGQDLETLLGKVLRIDPRPGETPPYEIPPGNPFAAQPGLDEIWAYGLRNPWRFSFDRSSGDMIIADVGQALREEIDHKPSPATGVVGGSGANYGWNCREGSIAYVNAPPSCDGADGFTNPVFDYPHEDPGGGAAHGCSITGGYVVRDPSLTDLYGRYVYADFCVGEIRSLALPGMSGGGANGDRSEGLTVPNPVSFGEDSSGRIYVVSNGGEIFQLAADEAAQPTTPSAGDKPTPPANGKSAPLVGRPPGQQRRPRVHVDAARRGTADSQLFRLTVRVVPCAGLAGTTVRLNRGGRPSGAKPLSRGCAAHFHRRVASRSTFRALLLSGGTALRSPRLVVTGAG
jgi:glucose/sorbosone dehydrogenase